MNAFVIVNLSVICSLVMMWIVSTWMDFCIKKKYETGNEGLWTALGIGLPVLFVMNSLVVIITILNKVVH